MRCAVEENKPVFVLCRGKETCRALQACTPSSRPGIRPRASAGSCRNPRTRNRYASHGGVLQEAQSPPLFLRRSLVQISPPESFCLMGKGDGGQRFGPL